MDSCNKSFIRTRTGLSNRSAFLSFLVPLLFISILFPILSCPVAGPFLPPAGRRNERGKRGREAKSIGMRQTADRVRSLSLSLFSTTSIVVIGKMRERKRGVSAAALFANTLNSALCIVQCRRGLSIQFTIRNIFWRLYWLIVGSRGRSHKLAVTPDS